jgi:hypothetical protein
MPDVPFAEVSDLISRGMVIPDGQAGTVDQLLRDATAHLRSLVGWVAPVTQSTVTLWASDGPQWLDIPLVPLISVDSVTVQAVPSWPSTSGAAVPVSVEQFDQAIRVCGPAKVTVTATHGFAQVPEDLRSWACVMASQAFGVVQELGTLGAGGVESIAIDDFRKTYRSGGSAGADPFALPQSVIDRLQEQYGRGAYVTGGRP